MSRACSVGGQGSISVLGSDQGVTSATVQLADQQLGHPLVGRGHRSSPSHSRCRCHSRLLSLISSHQHLISSQWCSISSSRECCILHSQCQCSEGSSSQQGVVV